MSLIHYILAFIWAWPKSRETIPRFKTLNIPSDNLKWNLRYVRKHTPQWAEQWWKAASAPQPDLRAHYQRLERQAGLIVSLKQSSES